MATTHSIYANAQSVPLGTDVPGRFSMMRHLASATYAAWTEVNFLDAAWLPSCPQLTTEQAAFAAALGVVRRVQIRLVSGTSISVADELVPSDRYNSADSTNNILSRSYIMYNEVHKQWWSSSGAVVLEVEVYFDIPATGT